MKNIFGIIFLLSISSSAFSKDGTPVIDQALFRSIREQYNGGLTSHVDGGTGSMEELEDGSYLLDISGELAMYLFVHMPKAEDEFLYIPSNLTHRWFNYYLRKGVSMNCGFYSLDLKLDPMKQFKCRMRIDSKGSVLPYLNRPGTNDRDFWSAKPLKTKVSVWAYGANDSRFPSSNHIQLMAPTALYNMMDVRTSNGSWGESLWTMKVGDQMWAIKLKEENNSGWEGLVKVRIGVTQEGRAYNDMPDGR